MCAERTTNSFLRAGSEPESLATRLADSRDLVWITALAWSETAREKCGRGLRSFPRAASSAKVWLDPVKSCSADAGLAMEMVPMAPAARNDFQRSPAV